MVIEQQDQIETQCHTGEKSILTKLLHFNRHYALLAVFDMFIAGIDSTVVASQTLLYQLAMNPDKQEKLLKEVFELLPQIDSPINPDSLSHASYFRACLKESMRMQPTVSTNLRSTGQDLVLNGYQVPKMVSFDKMNL